MSSKDYEIINARVTFRNLPLHKISNYSFKDIPGACDSFKKIPGVSECIVLQNPFRVEVFTVINLETGEAPDARGVAGKHLIINQIKETWSSLTELDQYDIDHFDQTFEVYKNTGVILHLLRLASGLESVVVGREGILDEIKDTIAKAKEANHSGRILNKLFDSTIRIATRIRESTQISKGIISLGDIAVKTAEDKIGMDKKHVLLVGTGEAASMVARTLSKKGYEFDVTSLSIERATAFSKTLGGKPIDFKDVISGFDKFDVVFVATTADYFIINYDRIKLPMKNKKKGTLILDVSDPRAVADEVANFPGIKLMFRDQIDEMFEEYVQSSKAKIPDVEKQISKEVPIIEATMNRLEAEPIVSDVISGADSIRKKELEKALEKLGETDEEKIKIIDELTKAVVKNLVSVPPTKKSEQEKQ